jgi:hypothetical protein
MGVFTYGSLAVFSGRIWYFGLDIFRNCDFFGDVFTYVLDDLTKGGINGADFKVVNCQVFELDFCKIWIPVLIPVLDLRPEPFLAVVPEKSLKNLFNCLLLIEVNKHCGGVNDALNDMNDVIFSKKVFGVKFNLTDQAIECLRTGELLPQKLDYLIVEYHHSLHVLSKVVRCHLAVLNI